MARAPKMASGKISLAHGIHRCFYFSCPTNFSILWSMCVYIHISDCV